MPAFWSAPARAAAEAAPCGSRTLSSSRFRRPCPRKSRDRATSPDHKPSRALPPGRAPKQLSPLSTAAGPLQSPSSASLSERSLPSKASSRSTHWSHLRFRKAAWMLSLTQTWPRLASSSNRICSRALKLQAAPQQSAPATSEPSLRASCSERPEPWLRGVASNAGAGRAEPARRLAVCTSQASDQVLQDRLLLSTANNESHAESQFCSARPSPDLLQLPWFRTRPFRQHPSARRLLGSASPRSHCMHDCMSRSSDCLHAWLSMISENDVSLTQHRLFGGALKFCKRKELLDNF